MNWLLVVGAIAFLSLVAVFGIWYEIREEKKSLERRALRIISEIKNDKKILGIIHSIIKKGEISPEEIVEQVGNELTARVAIERIRELGVMSNLFFMPVVYQKGTKFFIAPYWLNILQALDKYNWDTERIQMKTKWQWPKLI